MKPIEGTIARSANGCLFQLIRFDSMTGKAGIWAWYAVLSVQGHLPVDDDGGMDCDAILCLLADQFGIYCHPEQSGMQFARQPWIQTIGHQPGLEIQPRTLWISQAGGLDV